MEKTIISGKVANVKAIAIALFVVILVLPTLITFPIVYEQNEYDCASWRWTWDWVIEKYGENANVMTVTLHDMADYVLLYFLIAAVVAALFFFLFYKTELIVTDKRVYGKTSFGKRVDLPFDSISAVGTGILKTIAVTTASGAIKFAFITNRDEVHDAISNLLIDRQGKEAKAAPATPATPTVPQSNADELKKYKDLLDSGVISQEEFDAKKKQLLGL